MKRRRILLLLAVAVTASAAGLALFWPRGPQEPVYQGKQLTQWIAEANALPGLSKNEHYYFRSKEAALKAIRAIGTNALPWLMSEFRPPESKWRAAFNRWASAHPNIGFRFRDRWDQVRTAAFGLEFLGTNAATALPTLAPYLGDVHLGYWASVAMGGAGEMALPYFVPLLTSTNQTERMSAGHGLGRAVNHSDAAIPVVVQLAQHTNLQVRAMALMALGNANGRSDLLIPAYREALSSPDASILRVAAYSVARKWEVTAAVLPDLRRLMTNADPSVVRAATDALFRIDRAAQPPREP